MTLFPSFSSAPAACDRFYSAKLWPRDVQSNTLLQNVEANAETTVKEQLSRSGLTLRDLKVNSRPDNS